MPGETRSKSQANAAKTAAAARTSPVLIPQGVLEGQPEIPLNRPITTVGSNETARLHLLSRTVSKGHAIFVNSGGGTYVADLASRTGVLVNGKLGRDVILKNGDRVQIGKFVFRYRLPPNAPTLTGQPEAPSAAVIVVGWPALPVTGRVVCIGRSDRSDIALSDDASVSAPHAAIFQVDGHWYIRDMGSRTGTHVNGKAIHQQALNFGDRVVIGSSTILFQPGAMIEEESSIAQPEHEEIAPLAAVTESDDAIPLADDEPFAEGASTAIPLAEPANELDTTEPPAIDWSGTPATELPEESATDLSTDSTEPLPVDDVIEPEPIDATPSPLEEPEPLPLKKDSEVPAFDWSVTPATELPEEEAGDLSTESTEPLSFDEVIEPVDSTPIPVEEPEPLPATKSVVEPLPLEDVSEVPAFDWSVTPATEVPEKAAADLPTQPSEPLPVDDVVEAEPANSASIPAEEPAPVAATESVTEPLSLEEDSELSAIDWSNTPATELPEEIVGDLPIRSSEPLSVEDSIEAEPADSTPIPVQEAEHLPATKSLAEPLPLEEDSEVSTVEWGATSATEIPEEMPADLSTQPNAPLPVDDVVEAEPADSISIAAEEPALPTTESVSDPVSLEEDFGLPTVNWGATSATELLEEFAAELPTKSAGTSPLEDFVPAPTHSARTPLDETDGIRAEKSVSEPLPLEEEFEPQAIDWAHTPANEVAEEIVKPEKVVPATTPPELPSQHISDDTDDDLMNWSLPDTAPVHGEPAAIETPKAEPPPIPVDFGSLPHIPDEDVEWSHTSDEVSPTEEAMHDENSTAQPALTAPINTDEPLPLAEDSADEVFDWREPTHPLGTAAEESDSSPIAHEPIAAEPQAIAPPLHEEPLAETSAVDVIPPGEPDVVPAEFSWAGTSNTELPAEPLAIEPESITEAIESDEETGHEPVPVDISESSWINTPTPITVVPPPPIPPLPTWPAAIAKSPPPPAIDVHAPVDDFVFVPTDEVHDPNSDHGMLFFGDESAPHEVATDPVLVDRLEHSIAASPDATFDSAIEESLTESAGKLAEEHQHALENRPAHFDPVAADAAFDAALEESFAEKQFPLPAATLVPPEVAPTEMAASDVEGLDDRVAHFAAAIDDPAFDAALDETFAPETTISTHVEPELELPGIPSVEVSPAAGIASEFGKVIRAESPNLPIEESVKEFTPVAPPVETPAPIDDGFDEAFADELTAPASSDPDEAEPSWLTSEPPAANAALEEIAPSGLETAKLPEPTYLDPEPVDLHTLDLEDIEPESGEANISWSSLADEAEVADESPVAPVIPEPTPTASPLDDSHEHSGEEAIGWSALVSHDDVPTHGVTTISDDTASDVADLDFLDFHDEETITPVAPPVAAEEPLVPESKQTLDEPPPTTEVQTPAKPADPQGPGHGPSIFGFQFEGGSFLGGMPISLHHPEPPIAPVFDAAKQTPTGIGSMVSPPPVDPPKRKPNRPLTVPRPALPTIGDAAAAGKSLSGLVGEGTSTWAATPIIPPTAKPGSTNRQKRGLTTAFNAPGMAARNADVFSQLASPIGVEVFAGKPPAAVDEPLPELEDVEPVEVEPAAAPIAELPQLRKARRARWPWLVLLLGASVGGLWELAYQVPQVSSKLVTAKLVGSLQFDGFTSLSPVEAHAFLADQQARLASEDVRLRAQQILEDKHQPAGFTASSDDYSKTVDMQSLAWSGNTLQLTFNTNDPVAGSAQVNAVLAALASRDRDLDDARAKAKQAADDAHVEADAAAARAQQLSIQRRTQLDLAQDTPDLTTVSSSDQDATTLTQKWNDARITRENNESVLADLRAKDPSKPVDVEADPHIVELRKRLDPLKEQIARLKGINAIAAAPGTPQAIPAGATTRPEGDVDPLLAPLQQQADSLARKIDQRRAELAPDAGLTAAQREVDMTNRIENLSVRITALRQAETQAKTDADAAVAKAKQTHERLSAARLAGVKAEDLYNQETDAESDHSRAAHTQSDKELSLANCVTVAAVPIAPPTQFPSTDIRAPMFAFSTGIVSVILGLMILGDLRRPRYKPGVTPAAAPRATPPTPVVPWPRARELNGLKTNGQPEEPEQEQPPIIGEPDQVFGV